MVISNGCHMATVTNNGINHEILDLNMQQIICVITLYFSCVKMLTLNYSSIYENVPSYNQFILYMYIYDVLLCIVMFNCKNAISLHLLFHLV